MKHRALSSLQKDKSKLPFRIISWVLVLLCMATIFWFSAQVAEESASQSGSILSFLEPILGEWITDHIVRKFAHALEFCGLALLIFNALYQSTGFAKPFSAFGLTVIYAVTDELHQLFVPGRACRFFDVCVDSAGAVVGILGGLLLVFIYSRIKLVHDKKLKERK